MKTKLLLALSLAIAIHTYAGSATWNLEPTNGDWNTAANWMPNTVPNNPHDIATFDVSNVTAISLSADTSVDGAVFNPGASAFTITAPAGRTLIFSGQGVTNNSGFVQNFATETDGDKAGMIVFVNEATAGDSSVFTAGSDLVHGEDSFIKFFGNSSAGNATFVIEGGGSLAEDFYGSARSYLMRALRPAMQLLLRKPEPGRRIFLAPQLPAAPPSFWKDPPQQHSTVDLAPFTAHRVPAIAPSQLREARVPQGTPTSVVL